MDGDALSLRDLSCLTEQPQKWLLAQIAVWQDAELIERVQHWQRVEESRNLPPRRTALTTLYLRHFGVPPHLARRLLWEAQRLHWMRLMRRLPRHRQPNGRMRRISPLPTWAALSGRSSTVWPRSTPPSSSSPSTTLRPSRSKPTPTASTLKPLPPTI